MQDIFAIVGGFPSSSSDTTLSWSLIMSGGKECTGAQLPNLPADLRAFGLTQAHDQFIYLCGGNIQLLSGQSMLAFFRPTIRKLKSIYMCQGNFNKKSLKNVMMMQEIPKLKTIKNQIYHGPSEGFSLTFDRE